MQNIICTKRTPKQSFADGVEDKIKNQLNRYDYETGVYIGAKAGMISYFFFDEGVRQADKLMYVPNITKINSELKRWYDEGVGFIGFIHSHIDNDILSYADLNFAKNILVSNGINEIYMGVLNMKIGAITYYCVCFVGAEK